VSDQTISTDFLSAIPKTDLHVHLDGSLRISTLIELAREYNVELPSYTEEGLRELVFKDRYNNLGEYLKGFQYTVGVLQSEVALERCAYELALDNQAEGVRYIEVRFAPQLHVHRHLSAMTVLRAVDRGLAKAQSEFNQRPSVKEGKEPEFHYGIICSALRMFKRGFSEYYTNLLESLTHMPPRDVYSLGSLDLARAAVSARDDQGLPVVGFDLAGEEAGYPAEGHIEAFRYAKKHFLKKTVHAGEAYGPESIFQAVTDLYADRIGHGTYLLEPEAIQDMDIEDRAQYVNRLGQYIADRRITLEICLTSNLQTNPQMASIEEHTFRKMRDSRISTTLCTDNRLISNTTVTNEYSLAVDKLGLSPKDLKSVAVYGFKRSFFPGNYAEKRRYVRSVIDYYESLEESHLGERSSTKL